MGGWYTWYCIKCSAIWITEAGRRECSCKKLEVGFCRRTLDICNDECTDICVLGVRKSCKYLQGFQVEDVYLSVEETLPRLFLLKKTLVTV